jgi:hypothetical protein
MDLPPNSSPRGVGAPYSWSFMRIAALRSVFVTPALVPMASKFGRDESGTQDSRAGSYGL